jgi:mRNA interferase MazF
VSIARRGETWLVDFGEPVGRKQAFRRPALVISDDRLNAGPSGVVVVVPLTTRYRGLPMHVEVHAAHSGLEATSYAQCEDIRSVSDERLVARLGGAPPDVVFRVEKVLRWLLGMP